MIKEEFSMRDIDAFLNSLVNIDRNSLVAILSSEVATDRQVVNSAKQRTASQRARRRIAWIECGGNTIVKESVRNTGSPMA